MATPSPYEDRLGVAIKTYIRPQKTDPDLEAGTIVKIKDETKDREAFIGVRLDEEKKGILVFPKDVVHLFTETSAEAKPTVSDNNSNSNSSNNNKKNGTAKSTSFDDEICTVLNEWGLKLKSALKEGAAAESQLAKSCISNLAGLWQTYTQCEDSLRNEELQIHILDVMDKGNKALGIGFIIRAPNAKSKVERATPDNTTLVDLCRQLQSKGRDDDLIPDRHRHLGEEAAAAVEQRKNTKKKQGASQRPFSLARTSSATQIQQRKSTITPRGARPSDILTEPVPISRHGSLTLTSSSGSLGTSPSSAIGGASNLQSLERQGSLRGSLTPPLNLAPESPTTAAAAGVCATVEPENLVLPDGTSHLYFELKSFMCRVTEPTELYFSLYSADSKQFVSENWLIELTPNGLPSDERMRNMMKTLFREISKADIASHLWLVCRIYRVGALKYEGDHYHHKRAPLSFNHHAGKQAQYRRPFGCAVLNLNPVVISERLMESDVNEYEPEYMQIYAVDDDSLFCSLHELIIAQSDKIRLVPNSTGIAVGLQLFLGDYDDVKAKYPKLSVENSYGTCLSETPMLSCLDIVSPSDRRNDFYITLSSAKFAATTLPQTKKSKANNVQVKVVVKLFSEVENTMPPISSLDSGEDCIVKASSKSDRPEQRFISSVIYHSTTPVWNETFKINFPKNEPGKLERAVVIFIFGHCSKKNHFEEFGFSYLVVAPHSTMVLPNTTHSLTVYKHNKVTMGDIDFFAFENDAELRTKRATKHSFEVSTKLVSTRLTQNERINNLLKWKQVLKQDKRNTIGHILNDFAYEQSNTKELVKFIREIFDTLFSILVSFVEQGNGANNNKNSNSTTDDDDDYDSSSNNNNPIKSLDSVPMLAYKCLLIVINGIVTNTQYDKFRSVVEEYIAHEFDTTTRAHNWILQCMGFAIDSVLAVDTSDVKQLQPRMKLLTDSSRAIGYLLQFIVRSYAQSRRQRRATALGNKFTATFAIPDAKAEVSRVLSALGSVLMQDDSRFIGVQDSILKFFGSSFDFLLGMYRSDELATIIKDFLESVSQSKRARTQYKLLLLRNVTGGEVFARPDIRKVILPDIISEINANFSVSNHEVRELCIKCFVEIARQIQTSFISHIQTDETDAQEELRVVLALMPGALRTSLQLAKETATALNEIEAVNTARMKLASAPTLSAIEENTLANFETEVVTKTKNLAKLTFLLLEAVAGILSLFKFVASDTFASYLDDAKLFPTEKAKGAHLLEILALVHLLMTSYSTQNGLKALVCLPSNKTWSGSLFNMVVFDFMLAVLKLHSRYLLDRAAGFTRVDIAAWNAWGEYNHSDFDSAIIAAIDEIPMDDTLTLSGSLSPRIPGSQNDFPNVNSGSGSGSGLGKCSNGSPSTSPTMPISGVVLPMSRSNSNASLMQAVSQTFALWQSILLLLTKFVLDEKLQLELLNPLLRHFTILHSRGQDIRVKAMRLLVNDFWLKMTPAHQYSFIPKILELIVPLMLNQSDDIHSLSITMFMSALRAEFASTGNLKKCERLVSNTVVDELQTNGEPKTDLTKRLQGLLGLLRVDDDDEDEVAFSILASELVNGTLVLNEKISLLHNFTDAQEDARSDACLKVLQYTFQNEDWDLYLRYAHALYLYHRRMQNFVEAAQCLMLHANRHSWFNNNNNNSSSTTSHRDNTDADEDSAMEEDDACYFLYESGVADVPPLLPKFLMYPRQTEKKRKEAIYNEAIDLFLLGRDPESAMALLNELSHLYEHQTYEFDKLGEVLAKKAACIKEINDKKRFYCSYFYVAFEGSGFGDENGKKYIYRGSIAERHTDFVKRMQLQYPDATILHAKDKKKPQPNSANQFILVDTAVPMSQEQMDFLRNGLRRESRPSFQHQSSTNANTYSASIICSYPSRTHVSQTASAAAGRGGVGGSPKISARASPTDNNFSGGIVLKKRKNAPQQPLKLAQYFENNYVDLFSVSRTYKKASENSLPDNDFRDMWSDHTIYRTAGVFPGIQRRLQIIDETTITLTPILNAIKNISDNIPTLEAAIIAHRNNDVSKDTLGLSRMLSGIIDAPINGGMDKYLDAFYTDDYILGNPEELPQLRQFQAVLNRQMMLLKYALAERRKHTTVSAALGLSNHLEDVFARKQQVISAKWRDLEQRGLLTPLRSATMLPGTTPPALSLLSAATAAAAAAGAGAAAGGANYSSSPSSAPN